MPRAVLLPPPAESRWHDVLISHLPLSEARERALELAAARRDPAAALERARLSREKLRPSMIGLGPAIGVIDGAGRLISLPEILANEVRKEELQNKALDLLWSHLDESQQETLAYDGWFLVSGGRTRGTYRIKTGTHGNVDLLDAQGNVTRRYCCHVGDDMTNGDTMLAQKLSIEAAEHTFLAAANAFTHDGILLSRDPVTGEHVYDHEAVEKIRAERKIPFWQRHGYASEEELERAGQAAMERTFREEAEIVRRELELAPMVAVMSMREPAETFLAIRDDGLLQPVPEEVALRIVTEPEALTIVDEDGRIFVGMELVGPADAPIHLKRCMVASDLDRARNMLRRGEVPVDLLTEFAPDRVPVESAG